MTDDIQNKTLREALKALPRDIPPERDLWPEIAARIAPHRRFSRYWPVAAAIVAIAVGAIVAAVALHRPAPGKTFVSVPAQPQPFSAATPQNARAKTIAASIRKSTRLDPATQAVLLRNLGIIETSLANIQQALNREPDNTGLQSLLYQLYRDEAALLAAAQRVQLQPTTRIAL